MSNIKEQFALLFEQYQQESKNNFPCEKIPANCKGCGICVVGMSTRYILAKARLEEFVHSHIEEIAECIKNS